MMRALLVCVCLALVPNAAFARPVVAILADPAGTETTDLIAPYAILKESAAVEVRIVAPEAKPVRLMPGRAWIAPDMTYAAFDAAFPQGPDVVIVPFMMPVKDAARAAWLEGKAAGGARIVAICAATEILAETRLLDGRSATSHWASLGKLERRRKDVAWGRDARWVTDGAVTTTAGVSASAPAALALLAELAGEEAMRATAARLRLPLPDPAHQGESFRLTHGAVATGAGNALGFWRREAVALQIEDGFDDLAFAVALDGWSRTFRSEAVAVAPGGATSRLGLKVYGPERLPKMRRKLELESGDPFAAMLRDVAAAYGEPTARFVALQLEHPYWLQPERTVSRRAPASAPAD